MNLFAVDRSGEPLNFDKELVVKEALENKVDMLNMGFFIRGEDEDVVQTDFRG